MCISTSKGYTGTGTSHCVHAIESQLLHNFAHAPNFHLTSLFSMSSFEKPVCVIKKIQEQLYATT